MIYPHPKRGFTGYDPGRPDHVAQVGAVRLKRGYALVFCGEQIGRVTCWAKVMSWKARAEAIAMDYQQERAGWHAARLARITEYLAARQARAGGKQLEMF